MMSIEIQNILCYTDMVACPQFRKLLYIVSNTMWAVVKLTGQFPKQPVPTIWIKHRI